MYVENEPAKKRIEAALEELIQNGLPCEIYTIEANDKTPDN